MVVFLMKNNLSLAVLRKESMILVGSLSYKFMVESTYTAACEAAGALGLGH